MTDLDPTALTRLAPHELADLDQAHAAAMENIAGFVATVRESIAEHGVTIAAGMITAEIDNGSIDPDDLSGFTALEAVRIVQLEDEVERLRTRLAEVGRD